jgi:hypothetical protein
MRAIFGYIWGLWKDLKTSKILKRHTFWETSAYSSRNKVIFERLQSFREESGAL